MPKGPTFATGLIGYNAAYDVETAHEARARGNAQPYPISKSENSSAIKQYDVLFTVRDPAVSSNETPRVLRELGGLVSEHMEDFSTHEEQEAFAKAVLHNRVQYAGIATQNLTNGESMVSVALAGLMTIKSFQSSPLDVAPGQTVKAAVPAPSDINARKRGYNDSNPKDVYRMTVEAVDGKGVAYRAHTHMRVCMEQPAKWREAMGDLHRGTSYWMSFVKNTAAFAGFAGLMLIDVLVRNNVLQPTRALLGTMDEADRALVEGFLADNSVQPERAGDLVAQHLGEYLKIIDSKKHVARLTAAQRNEYHKMRVKFHQLAFHGQSEDGKRVNVAHEYGFVPSRENQTQVFHARVMNNSNSKSRNDPDGAMLAAQYNYFLRMLGSLATAVADDNRNVMGKAVTAGGSDINVALGVAA
jgi:hypothetical protein